MITEKELENILSRPESSILDYKEELYSFQYDKDLKNTSKLVKDVISFSNTIRNEKAYIIFGVVEKKDGSNIISGITNSIDDSILQDKVKDKVIPRPKFLYYELEYLEKKLGILEFPITKYEFPITPTIKLKGLEIGKVYFRNGSSNTEATGIDVIRINDWLKSLPGTVVQNLNEDISSILKRLTLQKEKLSTILADILTLSKNYGLNELAKFCLAQIQGIRHDEADNHKYRIQKVFISPSDVEINNQNPFFNITTQMIKKEMEENEYFFDYRILFNQPIAKIEELITKFKNNATGTFSVIKMSSQHMFKMGNYDIKVFIFEDTLTNLYSNIRQRIIDELMKY